MNKAVEYFVSFMEGGIDEYYITFRRIRETTMAAIE